MKKIIFVFAFFCFTYPLFSQTISPPLGRFHHGNRMNHRIGISTYVYPASIGIRWACFDSDSFPDYHDLHKINPRLALEFRTAFSASFAGEGNVIMVQPELNALFCRAHASNISFMSGLGIAFGYQNENDNYFGAYIPLVIEFCPITFQGCLSVKVEGDILYKKYPNFSSVILRPLVGVVYNIRRRTIRY